MENKLIKPGTCPLCDKDILLRNSNNQFVNSKKDTYAELWVLYDDHSNAMFPICKNCLESMTMREAKKLNTMQKYTWGMEIINTPLGLVDFTKQLQWYVSVGALLDIVKFGKSKEEILKND